MIGFRSGGVCTGTLIARNVVLTAGHCVQGYEDEGAITGFYLGAGAPIVSTAEDPTPKEIPRNLTRYEVDKVAIYPGFDVSELVGGHISTETPDLALLHLRQPVDGIPSSLIVDPETEAREAEAALVPGKLCFAVGYGRHDVRGTTTVKEKRVVRVSLAGVSAHEFVTERFDATSFSGVADEGDSGGPLLCTIPGMSRGTPWRIAGVVSYSLDGNGENHLQEHYVRLEPYAAWINAALTHFPEEERCTIDASGVTMRCTGQDLEYCDGMRWRPVMTCPTGKTCDPNSGGCR